MDPLEELYYQDQKEYLHQKQAKIKLVEDELQNDIFSFDSQQNKYPIIPKISLIESTTSKKAK